MRNPTQALWLLVVLSAVGCGSPGQEAGGAPPADRPDAGSASRPFVVFHRDRVTLDRLESPTPPPVAAGSHPGPETMVSDDPTVVSVNAAGDLVGHRNGLTAIRTRHGEGSMLVVEVADVGAIRLEPERLELRPGQEARIQVVGSDGRPVPVEGIQWGASAPRRAHVVGGKVIAGGETGVAKVLARVGGRVAEAEVVVRAGPARKLVVAPHHARLRPGVVKLFQATSAAGPVAAAWRSSNEAVIAPMQGGLFLARAAGVAEVCAVALDSTKCARVEVRP